MRRLSTVALTFCLLLGLTSQATAQRPGELIAAEPIVETPSGMQAWKLLYWTTTGNGRPIQASGMVAAPREAIPPRPRPVLAWTHGTWGITPKCGPSLSANFWTVTPGLDAVARGYTVVAPDYAGLGAEGVHPFLVGEDTARAVLDAIRAARAIPGAAAGTRYVVWGESQGGHAALWTAQRSRALAPELQLIGAAAAAPPTDLAANLRQAPNHTTKAFFTALISKSWSRHYGVPLSSFAGPVSQRQIQRLSQACISLESKPKLATLAGILTLQYNLRKTDLAGIAPWSRFARINSIATRGIAVPLLIAQNPKDDLVAPAVTRTFARAACGNGARVEWIDIAGEGHATSARDSAAATLDWIGERFAGKPPPSDCGSI